MDLNKDSFKLCFSIVTRLHFDTEPAGNREDACALRQCGLTRTRNKGRYQTRIGGEREQSGQITTPSLRPHQINDG